MLDLKRQYRALHKELLDAVGHVLETQQFILGEPVAAFERAVCAQLGVGYALGCSSGTDALWLALAAAGIAPGQAVITTPFSFFASVSCILRAGATAILADIDPSTRRGRWRRFSTGRREARSGPCFRFTCTVNARIGELFPVLGRSAG